MSLTPGLIAINGTDLATDDVAVEAVLGILAPAVVAVPTVAVPGPFGERPTGALGTLKPRRITARCTVLGTGDAVAHLAAVRALLARCAPAAVDATSGLVTIACDVPGVAAPRVWTGSLAEPAIGEDEPYALGRAIRVTLGFDCPDPCGRDATPTTVALSTSAADVPVGDAVAGGVITVAGPWTHATARTLTYKDAAGTTVATFTVTPATDVASGAHVEIDTEAETITEVSALGVRTLRASWRATTTPWFLFRPADALGTTLPTLQVSTGTASLVLTRRWR